MLADVSEKWVTTVYILRRYKNDRNIVLTAKGLMNSQITLLNKFKQNVTQTYDLNIQSSNIRNKLVNKQMKKAVDHYVDNLTFWSLPKTFISMYSIYINKK
jgi:hypothetical protein